MIFLVSLILIAIIMQLRSNIGVKLCNINIYKFVCIQHLNFCTYAMCGICITYLCTNIAISTLLSFIILKQIHRYQEPAYL